MPIVLAPAACSTTGLTLGMPPTPSLTTAALQLQSTPTLQDTVNASAVASNASCDEELVNTPLAPRCRSVQQAGCTDSDTRAGSGLDSGSVEIGDVTNTIDFEVGKSLGRQAGGPQFCGTTHCAAAGAMVEVGNLA